MLNIIAAFLTALALSGVSAARAGAQSDSSGCVLCHGAESKHLELDVHASAGIDCITCHGGSPGTNDQKLAHGDALRSLKDPRAIVESCGQCHAEAERMRGYGLGTDQLSLYWTSAHGQALAETGDPNVATCADCHGSHGIFPAHDPRSSVHKLAQPQTCGACHADEKLMARYDLDAGVVEQFTRSVHGVALLEQDILSSPSCTDCHGSHGARPPRVQELGRVCGSCHSMVERFFESSPHAAPAREGVIDECISCHDSHMILEPSAAMLAGKGPGNCSICHSSQEERGAQVAAAMYATLSGFDSRLSEAQRSVQDAAARGLFLSEEHSYLAEATSLRARMRATTHALSNERLTELVQGAQGMIDQTYQSLATRERALRDRRILTAVFFGLALLLAGVLFVYRRESFGSWRASRTPTTGPGSGKV